MNILFTQILHEIDQFIMLSEKASSKQSEYGIKYNEPNELELDTWNIMLLEAYHAQKKLHFLLKINPKKNLSEISRYLAFFRELPRYLAEIPYKWSAYYNDIENSVTKIVIVRREIDKKYHLGQHANNL